MTRLYRLAFVTAVATYSLIVLGGITRVSESGMGCADDWPRCHGRWYPPLNLQSIIEYLHRAVGASLGLLILATAIGTLLMPATRRRTRITAWAAFATVGIQGLLGAVTVWRELPAEIVTAHLGTAMILLSLTLLSLYFIAVDRGRPAWLVGDQTMREEPPNRRFLIVAWIGAIVIFLLVLSGASTSTTGAALACTSWPLCQDGQLIPDRTSNYTWLHLGHRAAAAIGILTVAIVAWDASRPSVSRMARHLTTWAGRVLFIQVLLGGAYVLSAGSPWLSAAHLAMATLLWALMVAIVIAATSSRFGTTNRSTAPSAFGQSGRRMGRTGPNQSTAVNMHADPSLQEPSQTLPIPSAGQHSGTAAISFTQTFAAAGVRWPQLPRIRESIADYVALTKPGIISLLLVTTLGAMLVAAEGIPALALVLATLTGGVLAAGGANVLNCYLDRDIDACMPRTRGRATVTGRISPNAALIFGVTLTILAVLELGLLVNWLAALLALIGNLYYVFVYTKWLKRWTPHNIVIGGAAGAVPPLVGWAAVTGTLSPEAWALFAIIFFWTPPHFWSLALLKQGEYGRAEVPMLPVVAGEATTRRQILLYSVILAAVCILLFPLGLGPIYLAGAVALNAIFIALAIQLLVTARRSVARRLFFSSLWYLALIFTIAVADRLILA